MKKLLFLVAFVFIVFLTGCLTLTDAPSVCDEVTEPSILCDLATEIDVRLETVGNAMIVVNAVAIAKGVYSEDDAREVILKLIEILDAGITYALFAERLVEVTDGSPGLMEVADVYLSQLQIKTPMYPIDKKILKAWLEKRLAYL